jgi:hypothetical protein
MVSWSDRRLADPKNVPVRHKLGTALTFTQKIEVPTVSLRVWDVLRLMCINAFMPWLCNSVSKGKARKPPNHHGDAPGNPDQDRAEAP